MQKKHPLILIHYESGFFLLSTGLLISYNGIYCNVKKKKRSVLIKIQHKTFIMISKPLFFLTLKNFSEIGNLG